MVLCAFITVLSDLWVPGTFKRYLLDVFIQQLEHEYPQWTTVPHIPGKVM